MLAKNLKKEVHFIGNTKIKQAQDWLHADKVIVYFNENNETKEYKASGNVSFEFKNEKRFYKGSAQEVHFYPLTSTYILKKSASIHDVINQRHIKGEEIKLNMLTGDADVKGSKTKPVKFIFDMESK